MLESITSSGLIYVAVALIVSIVLHEMMHGVMAYWLGDTTAAEAGRLTLNPLKSVDPFMTVLLPLAFLLLFHTPFLIAKPVPFNPSRVRWGEFGAALVGLAGPATNGLLAILGVGLYHLGGPAVLHTFAIYFVAINVGLMVFNLIPFPPLDGSRVLYAVAPEPVQKVMQQIESFGLLGILIFIMVIFQFVAPVVSRIDNNLLTLLLG